MSQQSPAAFGDWIKRRRAALDLTQADLAQRIGCATVTLRKIEAGERTPSRQLAALLAEQLGLAQAEHAAFVQFARDGKMYHFAPFNTPLALPAPHGAVYPRAHHFPPLGSLVGRDAAIQQLIHV